MSNNNIADSLIHPVALTVLVILWLGYGPWVAVGVAIGSFVLVNLFIILYVRFVVGQDD